MFFPSGQQQNNGPSCTEMIKQWWSTVPYFNRIIFWGCTGIYLISWFIPQVDSYGINTPSLTIQKFQLWRIVTACFVHIQLLQLLFCLLSLLPSSAIAERQQGSTLFIMNLMAEAILIQTLFAVISYALGFIIQSEDFIFYSAGLWSLVMVYISLRSFASPEEETNFLCFPIQIKQKYYPWLILLLFSIFSMFQIIDLFCGILVGYIEHKFFKGRLIKPSDQKLQLYEDKYFSSFKNDQHYIDVHQAGQQDYFMQQGRRDLEQGEQQEQAQQPAFGGSGTMIGMNRSQEAQNQIDQFHRERIEAQQRRQQQLSQLQAPQPAFESQEIVKQQKQATDLKPFSGKGISLGESSSNQAIKNQGYVSLAEDSKVKEQGSDLI